MNENLQLLQKQDHHCSIHMCLVDVLYWIDITFLLIYVLDVIFKVNLIMQLLRNHYVTKNNGLFRHWFCHGKNIGCQHGINLMSWLLFYLLQKLLHHLSLVDMSTTKSPAWMGVQTSTRSKFWNSSKGWIQNLPWCTRIYYLESLEQNLIRNKLSKWWKSFVLCEQCEWQDCFAFLEQSYQ